VTAGFSRGRVRILAQFDRSAAVAAQRAQKLVEIGFDTPFEGAMNQPWRRDLPSPLKRALPSALRSFTARWLIERV
jgi:hypothetical protein